MFERFTERARLVVVFAGEEARQLGHSYIGPEHLLLGLLCEEEGLAARVLESLDVGLEGARGHVARIVGTSGDGDTDPIPFSAQGKRALELALAEARSLGHGYVGTEHILLALARDSVGVGARVLLDLEVDREHVRTEVIRMLDGPRAPWHPRRDATPPEGSDLPDTLSVLAAVSEEIEQQLGRRADAGDLLLALACVPDGLAARTFAALEIDTAALALALHETRGEQARSGPRGLAELGAEVEKVREAKLAKIEAREFEAAAQLRDRERQLVKQVRDLYEDHRLDRALVELRNRLGLPGA